jgi:hypothetical protein
VFALENRLPGRQQKPLFRGGVVGLVGQCGHPDIVSRRPIDMPPLTA